MRYHKLKEILKILCSISSKSRIYLYSDSVNKFDGIGRGALYNYAEYMLKYLPDEILNSMILEMSPNAFKEYSIKI